MHILSNGRTINLEDIGCSVVSKNIRPYEIDVVKFKYRNMIEPIYVNTYPTSYNLELELSVESMTHEDALKDIFRLIPILHKCSLIFDQDNDLGIQSKDNFEYSSILTSYDFEFNTAKDAILKLQFDTEIYSEEIKGKIENEQTSLFIDGARETRINFEVLAKEDLVNFKINDFVIKKLAKGKRLIINSVDGLITVDGSIYSKREDMYFDKFPQVVGDYKVITSGTNADVYYSYKGRW